MTAAESMRLKQSVVSGALGVEAFQELLSLLPDTFYRLRANEQFQIYGMIEKRINAGERDPALLARHADQYIQERILSRIQSAVEASNGH